MKDGKAIIFACMLILTVLTAQSALAAADATTRQAGPTGNVTGTIWDNFGNALEDCSVYILEHLDVEDVTESGGRFTLSNVPAGDLTLAVYKDGFVRYTMDIQVSAAQTLALGDLVILKKGSVTGSIWDTRGNAVSGASIYILEQQDVETVTDDGGRFTLTQVPVGNLTLVIYKEGYERHALNITVDDGQSVSVGDLKIAKNPMPLPVLLGIIGIIALAAITAIVLIVRRNNAKKAVIDEIFFMYKDGRLIKHYTRRIKPDMDSDILSSMLVAVQEFVKDSFREEKGLLEQMKFGRFQILMGRGEHIIISAIILGEDLEKLRPQMQRCIDDIENTFKDTIGYWDGDIDSMAPASEYINRLIAGEYV